MPFVAARQPTFYFIGVTTKNSSIMRVFPAWARYWARQHAALEHAQICGIDFAPHAEPQAYRDAVSFIKNDPLSLGCLVTTHKLDLYAACHDLFDEIDPHARLMAETSCLSKRGGRLICHAKDPISSGLALDGFLPADHFAKTGAELFSMGAGGSTIALTWHMMQKNRGRDRPSRIIISNRSQARLDHIRHIHAQINHDIPVDYVLSPTQAENNRVLEGLKEGSLVINATGLGKDAPGSPISDGALFPEKGIVWELNYRGHLVFLDQARAQAQSRKLQIEDGWTYFIHGWTQVIAEVFDISIPTSGPDFDAIARIASDVAGR